MDAEVQAERKRWLSLSGLDAAKAGLALYIVGMLTSGIYYARFHVLALDFTHIQSVVVGVYLIFLYLAAPAGAVWLAGHIRLHNVVRIVLCIVLFAAADAGLARLLKLQWNAVAVRTVSTLILQLLLFVDWASLFGAAGEGKRVLQLLHQPARETMVALGIFVCVHFSLFWFPRIPGNFAGGMPVYVQVFTSTQGLPDSRFAATKDKPQINSEMDSYALWLLYQTDTDVYLLDSLPARATVIDDDVMRISKDQVIRMDYNTAPQSGN